MNGRRLSTAHLSKVNRSPVAEARVPEEEDGLSVSGSEDDDDMGSS
jgi:hypothetical protein